LIHSLPIVLLAFFVFCAPVFAQKAPPVIVTTAELEEISDRVEALGTLKANESIEVTATVTEKITAIHFDDGKRVEKNETLIEMTNDEEHAQLNEARATLSEARKQFNRYKELTVNKAASKSVLDLRRRDMETASARLNAIESRMSDRLIKAPFAGVVGLRNISVGALVEPGDVITTLHDDGMMKLDFSVPSTFLATLKAGLPITARARAYGEKEFKGTVKSVESTVNPITRSVLVRAILPNEEGLLIPGILMSVELFKNPRQAITVPEEALVIEGKKHFVYVATAENTADKRSVNIGTRFLGSVEILKGIEPGDKIITRGMMNIRPGQTIHIAGKDAGNQPLSTLLETSTEAKE
jgi:membrane fusion protein (multidrug efflux system)